MYKKCANRTGSEVEMKVATAEKRKKEMKEVHIYNESDIKRRNGVKCVK